MKKILALLLAMTLMFAMAIPAYAAEVGEVNSPAEVIIDYGWVIFAAIVVLAVLTIAVISFLKLPRPEQLKKVKEWLLLAVIEAENHFGSETGKLKLRYVYDAFLFKFPWLAKVISFETFAGLVDEALEDMENLLAENIEVYGKFIRVEPAAPSETIHE